MPFTILPASSVVNQHLSHRKNDEHVSSCATSSPNMRDPRRGGQTLRQAADAQDLALPSEIYRSKACFNSPGCTAIQNWGFTDKHSWIGSHSRGARGQALLFDRAFSPKAAYRAVFEELQAERPRARSFVCRQSCARLPFARPGRFSCVHQHL
jgi:glycosyl hydrolase family 10